MAGNVRHRPPHGMFKIDECMKIGHFDEAQKYCDENEEFYRKKAVEMQEKFLDIEKERRAYEHREGISTAQ